MLHGDLGRRGNYVSRGCLGVALSGAEELFLPTTVLISTELPTFSPSLSYFLLGLGLGLLTANYVQNSSFTEDLRCRHVYCGA